MTMVAMISRTTFVLLWGKFSSVTAASLVDGTDSSSTTRNSWGNLFGGGQQHNNQFQQTKQQQQLMRHLQLQQQQQEYSLENITVEVSPLWWPSEEYDSSYVHWPEVMADFFADDNDKLQRGGSPDFHIYDMFPEPERRIWPVIKAMTLRNHLENKILWLRPNYLIADGLDMGCRVIINQTVAADDGSGATIVHQEVEESMLCADHCTHRGRYCAPVLPANLPYRVRGKDAVLEMLRRLCIDAYYHSSDYKFFRYLENFERANCLYAQNMTNCSLSVIDAISFLDYQNIAECVGDPTQHESDVTNEKLEEQLTQFQKVPYGVDDMPVLVIGGVLYEGPFTTSDIFAAYCDSFSTFRQDGLHPLSCDVCEHCTDDRHCLWNLDCDGVHFDPDYFMANLNETIMTTNGGVVLPPPTDAPAAAADVATPTPAPPPVETPQAAVQEGNSDNGGEEEDSASSNKTIVIFFGIAISVSAIAAGFLVYRDYRIRQIREEIREQQQRYMDESIYRDSSYRDEDFTEAVDVVEDFSLRPFSMRPYKDSRTANTNAIIDQIILEAEMSTTLPAPRSSSAGSATGPPRVSFPSVPGISGASSSSSAAGPPPPPRVSFPSVPGISSANSASSSSAAGPPPPPRVSFPPKAAFLPETSENGHWA